MLEKDWVTLVFVLIFVLLSVAKLLYKDRLFKLMTVFFTNDYFLTYTKETGKIFNRFNFIIFIVQILIISLLIFEYLIFYKPNIIKEKGFFVFVEIALLLAGFLLLRTIIGLLLGYLFDVNKEQERLSFSKMSYLYSAALLILPLLGFTYYINTSNKALFILTATVFTILLTVRYVVIFTYNKNNVFKQLFNFILYLCALEIAPILLMSKIVINL